MISKYKFFFFAIVLLSACNSITYDPANFPSNPFLDIKAYFENEMTRSFSNPIEKTTVLDGKTETVKLDNIDLTKELKLFAASNLNKVSWYEKYSIDTSFLQSGNQKITYAAIDSSVLKTRRIDIFKDGSNIDSILIHNQLKSMIMDIDQYLTYDPKKGYKVVIDQEGKLQEAQDYSITVRY